MTNQELLQELDNIRVSNQNRNWLAELNDRKKKELDFHNLHRSKDTPAGLPQDVYEAMYGNKRFYETTQLSKQYVDNWIRTKVPGKVFLDYACGNGERVIAAASAGASLSIGLDISDVSIKNGEESALQAGVSKNCRFIQGDCENTGLPNESIDVVLCGGMLHHLDLSYAFPELRRILKKDGVILAGEALDYNPFIKLYRKLTPMMRTEWEKGHILSLKDIRFAKRFFEIEEMHFWHLFSIGGALFHERRGVLKSYLKVANKLDALLLTIPFIKLMAWQFTFELHKKKES